MDFSLSEEQRLLELRQELASALVAYAVGGFLTSLGFVLRADRVNARILSAK